MDVYIINRDYGNILNILQNEIIYGGYLAALGSPCLIISTSLMLNINISIPLLIMSYLLPLIVYSYDYYKDIEKDIVNDSRRAIYLKKKAKNYPLILAFYIISLLSLLALFSNYYLIIFILSVIIGGILYNTILKDVTKKIPAFKNVYTALTWALGGTFFILFYYSLSMNVSFLIVFFIIFMRCLINVIFFDLKDIKTDKIEGLKTLPVILGKENTIKFLDILNIISFIPLILGIYFNIIYLHSFPLIIFCIYGYYYINKAKLANSNELETVSHTLADFEFILWPMVLLIAQFIL